jgi:hypothetical protein
LNGRLLGSTDADGSKDFEKTIASAEAWVLLASIRVLSRRLARA